MVVQKVAEQWPVYTLAMVLGVGGGASTQLLSPPRPDPWTGAQAKAARDALDAKFAQMRREAMLDHRELEHRLRASRPPGPTRTRIEGLEAAVERLEREAGRDWAPPSSHFSELNDSSNEGG